MRKAALLQEVESPSEIQKGNCRKKWLVVVLLHGRGAFVSSHSLDGVGSDKLRKTAPLHCKGGLSERDLRRGKPSVVLRSAAGGGYFHPAGVPVSAQHCLVPRVSLFFGELSTFHGRSR